MSGPWAYKQRIFGTLSAFAVLCALSACSHSASKTDEPAPAGAPLLDEEKPAATDVGPAAPFADLNADKGKDDSTTAAAPPAGDYFYKTYGGESLRRIAVTLYGKRSAVKTLLEKNSSLSNSGKLGADEKVYFDMATARPDPRFLTKDLLARYSQPLAERLEAVVGEQNLKKTTVTLVRGDSLQKLSERLYGSNRYWTEIYLVNRDKIQNYDRVPAGLSLSVVDRPSLGVAKAETPPMVASVADAVIPPPPPAPPTAKKAEAPPAPVVKAVSMVTPTVAPMPTQPAPMDIQTAHRDPIPEVPPRVEGVTPTAPKVAPARPTPSPTLSDEGSTNSNLRRGLYGTLMLLLIGGIVYFTRHPKRAQMDMLDVTAEVGPRPKLPPLDNQNSQTG